MHDFHKVLELLLGDLNYERVAAAREILEAIQISSIVKPVGTADNCRDSIAVLEQLNPVSYGGVAQAKEMLKERIIKQEKFHDRVNALCRKLEEMPGKLVQMAQSDVTQEYNELRFEAFKYLQVVSESEKLLPSRVEQAANVDILSYVYCLRSFLKIGRSKAQELKKSVDFVE